MVAACLISSLIATVPEQVWQQALLERCDRVSEENLLQQSNDCRFKFVNSNRIIKTTVYI